ncbi:MAG: DUF5676 family membrane protein [Thermoanaerobaculia bacterium]
MRLDTRAIALAVGLGTAIAWFVCTAIGALAPGPAVRLTGYLFHVDASRIPWSMSLGGFLAGLIVWSLVAALFAAVSVSLYNRLIKS